jgi:oligoendopeptidase F
MNNKKKQNLKWSFSRFFKDDNDPAIEEERKLLEEKAYNFINKWKDRSDYLKDPVILKEALDEYEEWENFYGIDGNQGFYFQLRLAQEQENPELKAKFNKLHDYALKVLNDIQFFTHRISLIPKNDQKRFLESELLKNYAHFLKGLFDESKYLLSEPEEKILNLFGKTSFGNWVDMTEEFLSKEQHEVLEISGNEKKIILKPFNEIMGMIDNSNKEVRDTAAKAINTILRKFEDVAEVEINSVLEHKKVSDTLRKVSRPDELRHLSDDIETEIVDSLVESVSARFDLSQRFYRLKARLMQVEKLEYHERGVPYGKVDKKYSFEDSVELVGKVFQNLHPDFYMYFRSFIQEERIDVYPEKGKSGGAFMASGLKSQPLFILLNHNDKLQDVLTLAHEVGHGIHYEYAKKQNSINYGASTATAEVASTFMEDFVLQEIMQNADDELRLGLIMMKLADDVSTIMRQVACYKFETELHGSFREKGYLSKGVIGEIFLKNMKAYMGDAINYSEGSQNWWIYWSHIRRFFYVYSYASGLLISKSLQSMVRADKNSIQKVITFFEAGTSKSTKDIFLETGINIAENSFWQSGLEEIKDLLDEAEELALRLGAVK